MEIIEPDHARWNFTCIFTISYSESKISLVFYSAFSLIVLG